MIFQMIMMTFMFMVYQWILIIIFLYSKISYSDHFVNSITNNDLIIVLSNHPGRHKK